MKHYRIVHRLPWRLRSIAPPLARQVERCYLLEILLRKHPAVRDVVVVAEIGSLTVRYDPAVLPEARLLATLDAILGNLLAAPKVETPAAPVDGPRRSLVRQGSARPSPVASTGATSFRDALKLIE